MVIHESLLRSMPHRELLVGSAYVILSGLLIFYTFFKDSRTCPRRGGGIAGRLKSSWPFLFL